MESNHPDARLQEETPGQSAWLERIADWHGFSVELAGELRSAGLHRLAAKIQQEADAVLLGCVDGAGSAGSGIRVP